jgi:broad specificity phosphatase PhoE
LVSCCSGDSKDSEWADLYASDAQQQQQAWADDYASADELAAARAAGSDGAQWAAEYDEQQDEDQYGDAEDYDPEDWAEDFNYLDWNSLNAAKQAMNAPGWSLLVFLFLDLRSLNI